MFKQITTLIRGRGYDAAEALTDANALAILRQQLRDAAKGVAETKRSVAVVMAYAAREKHASERLVARITDLEARAVEALKTGQDDLAAEAANSIAELEAEQQASAQAIAHYDTEIARLREQLSLSEHRLRVLQRGKQIADAAERTQRVRGTLPGGVINSLRDAEETLARLQARHSHADAVEDAMSALDVSTDATLSRLAEAGCGPALRPDPKAVMARLRQQAA